MHTAEPVTQPMNPVPTISRDAKIYVAGHGGLVGSALCRALDEAGYGNVLARAHAGLDLCRQADVEDFFAQERPDIVLLAAARVGGILANDSYPAEFIRENLLIQTNVIDSAWRFGAKKLLFLGSSCIYPRECAQPIAEEALLGGPLESTNEAYAIAKIAGIKMCQAYRRQYGFDAIAVMPTNLYGPGDSYHAANSHVIPAMIRRFAAAAREGLPRVTIWGTGLPRREFLYSDDMARACLFLLERYSDAMPVNIGCGKDMTIGELARMVAAACGYTGEIGVDPQKPDGVMQKRLDVRRLFGMGWRPRVSLAEGLRRTVEDYLACGHDEKGNLCA